MCNVPKFYKAQISQIDMNLMKTVFLHGRTFWTVFIGLSFLDK